MTHFPVFVSFYNKWNSTSFPLFGLHLSLTMPAGTQDYSHSMPHPLFLVPKLLLLTKLSQWWCTHLFQLQPRCTSFCFCVYVFVLTVSSMCLPVVDNCILGQFWSVSTARNLLVSAQNCIFQITFVVTSLRIAHDFILAPVVMLSFHGKQWSMDIWGTITI
jgi:hypothetical protein